MFVQFEAVDVEMGQWSASASSSSSVGGRYCSMSSNRSRSYKDRDTDVFSNVVNVVSSHKAAAWGTELEGFTWIL